MARPPFTCGLRVVGLYVAEGSVYEGSPVETFIPCPPPYIDMEGIGLNASGMRIIERVDYQGLGTGVFDLWDYVSTNDNPWPTDFIEQSRHFGTSRRFPSNLTKDPNFQKLKAHPHDPALSSRHIYVHARAIIVDPEPFYQNRTGIKSCPQGIEGHDNNTTTWETCAGLWWEMVGLREKKHQRRHKVYLPRDWEQYGSPSCGYEADHIPDGVAPTFMSGMIMSIPLMKMEIPVDISGDNQHEKLAKLLEEGGWQYSYEITEE